jgi:hypothetical protein
MSQATKSGRLPALFFHESGQFGAVCGLAGALEAHQHDHRGRFGGNGQFGASAAHECGQLFVYDFNDHLRRGQALKNVRANRALGDLRDELFDYLIADVCFQKSHTDFPHGFPDIRFGQAAFAAQLFEGGG